MTDSVEKSVGPKQRTTIPPPAPPLVRGRAQRWRLAPALLFSLFPDHSLARRRRRCCFHAVFRSMADLSYPFLSCPIVSRPGLTAAAGQADRSLAREGELVLMF